MGSSAEILGQIPAPRGLAYLPYQEEGIRAMASASAVLVADEMGLGKTITAIGILNCHPEIEAVLIVCPASLAINWRREVDAWLISPCVDVVITSYDSLPKLDLEREFDAVVFDESHYLKEASARRSRYARRVRARRRILLTGTPIPNRPIEIWHQLHVLDPLKFPLSSADAFAFRFCGARQVAVPVSGHAKGKLVWRFDGASNLPQLARGLRPLMLRRLKRDVLKDLPPKRRRVVDVVVDDPALLRDLAHAGRRWAHAVDDPETEEFQAAFAETAILRHRAGAAKVAGVAEFVRNSLESEQKVVVFGYHLDVIESLGKALAEFRPVVVVGGTALPARQRAVDVFQDPNSRARVFIGQIKAAGTGLTLTAAAHVVFAEMDWSPGVITQAEDRCHRYGQKSPVWAHHLSLANSIDARMARALVRKQNVVDAALAASQPR